MSVVVVVASGIELIAVLLFSGAFSPICDNPNVVITFYCLRHCLNRDRLLPVCRCCPQWQSPSSLFVVVVVVGRILWGAKTHQKKGAKIGLFGIFFLFFSFCFSLTIVY